MAKLKNTQIKDLVNSAYEQTTGQVAETALDLADFVDSGTTLLTDDNREKFTGALIGVCTKNWFKDTAYRSLYNDIFYEDSERFGAIIQTINATIPKAIDNKAWGEFISGTTKVGQYTVYLPVVDTKYYTKSTSWAIPITITHQQWDTAFHNERELSSFVNYVFMMVDNALVQHLKDMNAQNRNNFIAEKIIYSNKADAKGIHVIDLVKEYCNERSITTNTTAKSLLNNRDFLVYSSAKMTIIADYFKEQTSLFNTEQKIRFTPPDRLACQVISEFENKMESVAYTDSWHNEFIKLINHDSVAWWQNPGNLSFEDSTSINVEVASGTLSATGIVAILCDKWAIIHTIRSEDVASQNFPFEHLTHYEYQHRDSYMNDLTMNAVIFTMNDFIVTP